ncbi:MAG: hypothetical protein HC883_03335, partial [Bdellovibrionaceae bacterium]|nr:hypothetical protein [Pseudobdellovibrionaceae bacterium]
MKPRPWFGLAFGVTTLVALALQSTIIDEVNNVFEPEAPESILEASPLKFKEVSREFGIRFRHNYFFPHVKWGREHNKRVLSTMFPAISV